MALDGFPDVYDWICHLQPTLKDESLQLTSVDRSVIYMHAYSDGNGVVFLSLWWDYGCLAELGEFRIEECSEEEMQENLFPLFFNLCVYAFLGVTRKVIATMALWPFSYRLDRLSLKKFMKHNMPSSWRSEEHMLSSSRLGFSWPKDEVEMVRMATDGLQRLGIGSGTVESAIFKRAFNSIFRAASYSHALQAKTQLTTRVDLEMQKFMEQIRKETLVIIGPDATHRLMKFLATKFAEISLRYGSESINPFEVSYSSRLGRYWTLNAYCPRLSMQLQVPSNQDKKKDALLELALSHQLMHCLIHFNHGVTFYRDWIDVELHIDNLRCQAFQLDSNKPIPSNLEKEWYFPAKIALTIWPEYKSGVHAVSLGASSQNPQVTVTRERSEEASLKAEQAIGTKVDSSLGAEFKVGRKISFSNRLNNWVFDLSAVNNTGGRLEWTLYDNSYGMPVFSYTPPQFKFWNGSTWSTGNSFKAFRAFAQEQGSVRPFTPGGGVVFARDVYGTPITWRLNRDLEGQTLKWIVEGEIWFAYYPNKYHTQYMEIRSHKFCEQVELPLLQS